MRCIAAPLRIKIPFSAPFPLPTISAVGVASPNAHGQAMTSTATAAKRAIVVPETSGLIQGKKFRKNCVPIRIKSGAIIHNEKVTIASANTIGTKTAVTRSAKAWMGTLVVCASSTIFAI